MAPILVYATSVLALSMLDEAALSFLGMGVQPPTASLGNMLNGAQSLTVLTKQPWLWIPPGLMIVILVIAHQLYRGRPARRAGPQQQDLKWIAAADGMLRPAASERAFPAGRRGAPDLTGRAG